MKDIAVDNFQEEVILKSHEIPVLVDFWAPWCGPCKVLGPVLEKLEVEQGQSWTLVKINVDENQELAQQFNVQGIPSVKLFANGSVIGEFSGASSRSELIAWLEEHLPAADKAGLREILSAATAWPDQYVIDQLIGFVAENPNNIEAQVALAKHLLFTDALASENLIKDITEDDVEYAEATYVSSLARLCSYKDNVSDNEMANLMQHAANLFTTQDFNGCIELLIEGVVKDKNYDNDLPRLAGIAIFNILGRDHSTTHEFRRRFDMSIY